MADRANPFRNIRVILRPSPRKLKVLFAVLLLTCVAALAALSIVRARIQAQTREALHQAGILEQENADLAEKKSNLGSKSAIKEIAKEELGLVDPDTIILDPNS